MSTVQQSDQHLIFKVENDLYGLDVSYLKEVFQTKEILKLPRTSEILAGIVNLRGTIITIFDLSKLVWGVDYSPQKTETKEKDIKVILLLTIKGQDVGILVDQIQQLTDLTEFAKKDSSYYSNRTLQTESLVDKIGFLPDKSSILILNLEDLFSEYFIPAKKVITSKETEDDFDFDQYTLPDEPTDEFSGDSFKLDTSFDVSLDQLSTSEDHEVDQFDLDFQEKLDENEELKSKEDKGKKGKKK